MIPTPNDLSIYLSLRQGVPLTAVDIKLFDDEFNKFEPHEACWDIKKRGADGETILHLCLVGDSETHLTIANILLDMYPKMALDFYEGDEYYGEKLRSLQIVRVTVCDSCLSQ